MSEIKISNLTLMTLLLAIPLLALLVAIIIFFPEQSPYYAFSYPLLLLIWLVALGRAASVMGRRWIVWVGLTIILSPFSWLVTYILISRLALQHNGRVATLSV
jgi:hypothetical protein